HGRRGGGTQRGAQPAVVVRRRGAGGAWTTASPCGSWGSRAPRCGSRRHLFPADRRLVRLGPEPPTGEHLLRQGRRALLLDRAPVGARGEPTTGGMTCRRALIH